MDEPNKVEKTGVYKLPDGSHVRLKEGDVLPLGAEWRDAGEDPVETARGREKRLIAEAAEAEEQRVARTRATENRATRRTAESRAADEEAK